MLRLTFTADTVLAHRGPNRLKLFEEPAQRFLPGAVSRGHFNPLSGQAHVSALPACRKSPARRGAALRLVPSWRSTDVSLTQVRGAELVKAILSSTMNTRLHTPARLARQFGFAERLARLFRSMRQAIRGRILPSSKSRQKNP